MYSLAFMCSIVCLFNKVINIKLNAYNICLYECIYFNICLVQFNLFSYTNIYFKKKLFSQYQKNNIKLLKILNDL